MCILKVKSRIVDLSETISNQIYRKMDKLCINKIQDYLADFFKKEIFSSDLRQVLQKHYDCQMRKRNLYFPPLTPR